MASNSLRSGWATLEYEIAEERASALGRLGRRLEAALEALAACPPATSSERTVRDNLVGEAGYALWLLIVQREACGLNDSTHLMQTYAVPSEVYARVGPPPCAALAEATCATVNYVDCDDYPRRPRKHAFRTNGRTRSQTSSPYDAAIAGGKDE